MIACPGLETILHFMSSFAHASIVPVASITIVDITSLCLANCDFTKQIGPSPSNPLSQGYLAEPFLYFSLSVTVLASTLTERRSE